MKYPWSVFKAFIKAGHKREKARSAEQFTLLFIATRGSAESVNGVMKGFR